MAYKRKRSCNWDDAERVLLRALIEKHITAIHNRNTDTQTNKARKEAWAHIYNTFTKLNRRSRSLLELKIQWKNTKLRLKGSVSQSIALRKKTCDGSNPLRSSLEDRNSNETIPIEFIPEDKTVKAMILGEFIDIAKSSYDCDSQLFDTIEEENVSNLPETTTSSHAPVAELITGLDSSIVTPISEDIPDNLASTSQMTRIYKVTPSSKRPNRSLKNPILRSDILETHKKVSDLKIKLLQLEIEHKKKEHERLLEIREIEHMQLMQHREEIHRITCAQMHKGMGHPQH